MHKGRFFNFARVLFGRGLFYVCKYEQRIRENINIRFSHSKGRGKRRVRVLRHCRHRFAPHYGYRVGAAQKAVGQGCKGCNKRR